MSSDVMPKKWGSVCDDVWNGELSSSGRSGYRSDASRVRFSSGFESMNRLAHTDNVAWPCSLVTNPPSGI